jgi:hypothetical protein
MARYENRRAASSLSVVSKPSQAPRHVSTNTSPAPRKSNWEREQNSPQIPIVKPAFSLPPGRNLLKAVLVVEGALFVASGQTPTWLEEKSGQSEALT